MIKTYRAPLEMYHMHIMNINGGAWDTGVYIQTAHSRTHRITDERGEHTLISMALITLTIASIRFVVTTNHHTGLSLEGFYMLLNRLIYPHGFFAITWPLLIWRTLLLEAYMWIFLNLTPMTFGSDM